MGHKENIKLTRVDGQTVLVRDSSEDAETIDRIARAINHKKFHSFGIEFTYSDSHNGIIRAPSFLMEGIIQATTQALSVVDDRIIEREN